MVDNVGTMKVSGIEARVLLALRAARAHHPERAAAALAVLEIRRPGPMLSTVDDLFSSSLLRSARSDDSFSSSPWDETSTD